MGKELKVYAVIWEDTATSHGWSHPEEIRDFATVEVVSVGIVLTETKKHITLIQSMSGAGAVTDAITIPKAVVKKKVRLHTKAKRNG